MNLGNGLVRFVRKAESLPRGNQSRKPEQLLVVKSSSPAICDVQRRDGCHLDLNELRQTAQEIVRLAGSELMDMEMGWSLAPHSPPRSLPNAKQAVYCFFLQERCLKVGKVGPRNNTRFVYHHYGCHSTSSLPKSILANKKKVLDLLGSHAHAELQTLDEQTIGPWVKQHTSRLNLLLPASVGPHVLTLVEAFLHVRLQPLFEGHD